MSNKAHTATLNRICLRYEAEPNIGDYDVETDGVIIEVETSASVQEAVERLKSKECPVYIAVTNKEGIQFATEQVQGTDIGVMDPQGNVIQPSRDHQFPEV